MDSFDPKSIPVQRIFKKDGKSFIKVYFQRKKTMKPSDYSELVDTFLFESLKDTDFDYYYDYLCSASDSILLHGKIDYLIYHKKKQLPLIPVIKVKQVYNRYLDMYEEHWNKAEVIGVFHLIL